MKSLNDHLVAKKLSEITAFLDDTADGNFRVMTRSPYHLAAWFVIFAGLDEPSQKAVAESLYQAHQERFSLEIPSPAALLAGIIKAIENVDWREYKNKFSEFTVKFQSEVDKENYLHNLARFFPELLSLGRDIVGHGGDADCVVITEVKEEPKWLATMSHKGGHLVADTAIFYCQMKDNQLQPITSTEACRLLKAEDKKYQVVMPYNSPESKVLFPLPEGKEKFSVEVPETKVKNGLYGFFVGQGFAQFQIKILIVKIEGKSEFDKEGAMAAQKQSVLMSKGGRQPSPGEIKLLNAPTVIFPDTKLVVNFSEPYDSEKDDVPVDDMIFIGIYTKGGGYVLTTAHRLSSQTALKVLEATEKFNLPEAPELQEGYAD
ncbi:MAG: hypothetical protein AABY34_06480, partial [Pseudomonadota bacterium]